MKRYSEYKDSGVKWIGEIPGHWKIVRLKFVTENLDYLREPISAELRERKNPQYDYYGASGIIDKIDHYNVDDKVLLIGEDGANLLMRNLPLVYRAEGKFWVNNHAHILKTRLNDYSFFAHLLESQDYTLFVTGTAQPKLSQFNLGNVPLPISPINEQKIMGKYLDSKVAKIDEYISIAEKKIAALEELKQTIIAEAVTRGIHKDVPMKDSGVKWIGMIPEHWKVLCLKYLSKIKGRIGYRGYTAADLVSEGEGAFVIGGKHINQCILNTESPDYISWDKYYESPEIMVSKGDIVMAQRGSLGKVALIDKEINEATINPSLVLIKDICCDASFLYFYLRSNSTLTLIELLNTATAVPMISQKQIEKMPIPLPPLPEQQEIVTYIEAKAAKIDQLCQAERSQIEKLKEYKQRLISDVVTGKVKVTND